MRKFKNIFCLILLFYVQTEAQYLPNIITAFCHDNKSIVAMNYDDNSLSWINIESEQGKAFKIDPMNIGTYGNISVLNDSLVLLSGSYIYNYKTGVKVKEFEGQVSANPSGKRIFQQIGNSVFEIDHSFNQIGKILELSSKRGTPTKNLMKINENADFIAVTTNTGNANLSVDVYNTKDGKLIHEFDGFKNNNEKSEINFLDISKDGSQLIIGNKKKVALYNVQKGKKVAEFEEIPTNNRKNFMQASFRADGKAVYISSWYKIYTLNTTKFEAEANIVVSNDIRITKWRDQHGYTTKESTHINTEHFWSTYSLSHDEKYIVGLMEGVANNSVILCYMYLGDGGVGNKKIILR